MRPLLETGADPNGVGRKPWKVIEEMVKDGENASPFCICRSAVANRSKEQRGKIESLRLEYGANEFLASDT